MTEIKAEGGTIHPTMEFLTLGDNGLVRNPKWGAQSDHIPDVCEIFWTQGAAIHWLWLINERVEAKAYREANQA